MENDFDDAKAVREIVNRYTATWRLLWQYDESNLPPPGKKPGVGVALEVAEARNAIAVLKKELLTKGEATAIFGQERGDGLAGIIGALQQTFGGQELYPSAEEKAAHLLYFIIKDHPFTDGNKRIGAFLFLLFLEKNGLLPAIGGFDNRALVAMTLLVAVSNPGQKDLHVRLIVNLIGMK
ncbi:MAG: Fic family protein [Desulfurivibrio sp.]|nr:Fic family protein [Desulfurivibrio sp.]